ncbi:hypothetical protein NC653_033660 [Populus alba x Populus x berolinensis]|uniref:Uncharacterized protein n=1 Tax=Populus alba x Populus x berolinensis TaxID=444605 RepID=A0AAD6LU64_9ROSI|nr:hypothetical protein NC653_033660 [Populus alba x Populus x berolinensis]
MQIPSFSEKTHMYLSITSPET